jgi:hypothetical protein
MSRVNVPGRRDGEDDRRHCRTTDLTVHEPADGVVHFTSWRPFDQDALSRSAGLAPAREDDRAGRGE